MAEGGIIPDSERKDVNRQDRDLDIQKKTIKLHAVRIKFPFNEGLTPGRKRDLRYQHLLYPRYYSREVLANVRYIQDIKERRTREIIDELRKRGHRANLLVRGLGRFYDEKSPPIQGTMNFYELQNIERGQDPILGALSFVLETRLIMNAEEIESDFIPIEEKQELLKRPVAVMVADRTKSTKIGDPTSPDWNIKPDSVVAIFTFHIDDPLVRDFRRKIFFKKKFARFYK